MVLVTLFDINFNLNTQVFLVSRILHCARDHQVIDINIMSLCVSYADVVFSGYI